VAGKHQPAGLTLRPGVVERPALQTSSLGGALGRRRGASTAAPGAARSFGRRAKHGTMLRLRWKETKVRAAIRELPDKEMRHKTKTAYDYLCQAEDSVRWLARMARYNGGDP
ncbi:unnamed protein product, partial [Effrenium voratum]